MFNQIEQNVNVETPLLVNISVKKIIILADNLYKRYEQLEYPESALLRSPENGCAYVKDLVGIYSRLILLGEGLEYIQSPYETYRVILNN